LGWDGSTSYDVDMNQSRSLRTAQRWTLWLAAGVVLGLLLGFAAGLARPRAQTPRIGTA